MCGDGCTKPCHQENKTCYFNVEVLRHDLNGAKAFSKIDHRLNKSNLMHNIPFIPGGIDNLSRDSRSISRDV